MMKRSLQITLAFLACAMIAGAAQAQTIFGGVWNPEVGSGAVYEIPTKNAAKNSAKDTVDVAVVGKESVNGKQGYWMEVDIKKPTENVATILKMLVVRDGTYLAVKRGISQLPGHPPIDVGFLAQGWMQAQPTDIRREADDLGPAVVTTPAGTFACEHYKLKSGTGDVWIKAKTGPWGLVKSVSTTPLVTSMTLIRVITNAKDKITGTPQAIN